MSMPEVMSEYLVKLSADIDTNSFNAAMGALNSLVGKLKNLKQFAAIGALASGFVAMGKAAIDAIKSVASADMQFQKLANTMWITVDSAKALSTAIKVMGVSEEDIAWIPELREQFFRLREEMNQLATPADADSQLKWIREIGYDIQSLQVKLKMLKEWIVYYLIKYLHPFIKEFQQFIQWVSDKLGNNLPQIAKNIARFLSNIVALGVTVIKVVKSVIGTIYDFVESLPANVKKWGAIFSAVGAMIMAGPFGAFIAAIGGALILLQDFLYYMNGWKSSKTLAPIWEKLLNFLEGDTLSSLSESVKKLLGLIANQLDFIVKSFVEGVDWQGIFDTWSDGVGELFEGVKELFSSIVDLFDEIQEGTGAKSKAVQQSFWSSVGSFISSALKELGNYAGMLGKIAKALALIFRGDFAGAARLLGQTLAENTALGAGIAGIFGHISSSADEKANTAAAMGALQKGGLSKAGAAALSGNFSAESNMDPSALEGMDANERADFWGNLTYERFMAFSGGIGIGQWTEDSRKRNLWDYWQRNGDGRALNDLGLQLEFALWELQTDYRDLYDALQTTDDERYASDRVLHEYERPLDQSSSVEIDRQDRAGRAMDLGFADTRNSFISPNSWAAAKPSSFVQPASYATTNNTTRSVQTGNIIVNVSGSNAAPEDIGAAVADVLDARFGRGALV